MFKIINSPQVHVTAVPKNHLGIFSSAFLFFLVLTVNWNGLKAQGPKKDTIEIVFEVLEQSNNATEFVFYGDVSMYDIDTVDTKLVLDLTNSWFIGPGDTYDYDLYLTNDNEDVFLRIEKTSGSSSGSGEVARAGGLTIILQDGAFKTTPTLKFQAETVFVHPMVGPSPYSVSESHPLNFSHQPDSLELWTLEGKQIAKNVAEMENFLNQNPPIGIYLIKTTKQGKVNIQKFPIVK